MSIVRLILEAGLVAKGVLGILFFFSLASWTVIFLKLKAYRKAEVESERFLSVFRNSKNFYSTYEEARRFRRSPIAALFREGYRELSLLIKANPAPGNPHPAVEGAKGGDPLTIPSPELLEGLSRTLRHASLKEISELERYLIFLATTGSVTPFIGLFGTVWGIIDAFAGIGLTGTASLGAVAPGIAEALVNTAAGLAAAIPAVIAYNYCLNRVKTFATTMDLFTLEFLSLAGRLLARSR